MKAAIFGIALLALPLVALAEDAATTPGHGEWRSSVATGFIAPQTVALDTSCDDAASANLREVLVKALAKRKIGVDPAAPIVLRYEVQPCAAAGRRESEGLRDAYEGSSRNKENADVVPQFSFKFGKKSEPRDHLALSMMLFAPGKSPVWRVETSANRSEASRDDQFAALARSAVEAFGVAGEGKLATP